MQITEIPKTTARKYCHAKAKDDGRICTLYANHFGDHKPDHKSLNTSTFTNDEAESH